MKIVYDISVAVEDLPSHMQNIASKPVNFLCTISHVLIVVLHLLTLGSVSVV